jgi:branched-chain amino acid transport system ATP-binding protein
MTASSDRPVGAAAPRADRALAAPPLLRVQSLVKAFGGVRAVDDVSFDLARGELLALIGPNGAGKSTCFNCINGQLRPDRGQILLEGQSIGGRSPRAIWRLGVGRTFQIAATWASMTVCENLQLALLSHAGRGGQWWGRADRLERQPALALLAAVGLADAADRPCGTLAYGDVKRLELAMALSNQPRLLLMAEPTAGMAPRERHDMLALVARLVRERDIGVLFTEHSMDVVFAHADRIVVLAHGTLIAQGSPDVIRADEQVRTVYLGRSASTSATR